MNNHGTTGDYAHQQHNIQIPVHSTIASPNNMFGNQDQVQHHFTSATPVQSTVTVAGAPTAHHPMQTNLTPHQQTATTEVYLRQTMEVEAVVNLEQCCICSTYFEPSGRSIPHPDLNRIICKVLDVTPAASFYKDYLSLCVNCTNLLRKFDRLLVELEFTKTQIVTYVVESLTQIRAEDGSQLDCLKSQIIDRWTSGQRDSKKKGREKEGFSAAGSSGDLSWAAHNNVMKNSSVVTSTPTVNWKKKSEENAPPAEAPAVTPADPDYPSDNDHGGDDFFHASDADDGNDNETTVEQGQVETCTKTEVHSLETDSKPKRKRKRQKKKSGPLVCINCGRLFSQPTTYNGHAQVCESDDLGMEKNCTVCTEEENQPCIFETWQEFKTHVNLYHPLVKLEACAVCRINFLPHGIKYHKCSGPYNRSRVDKEAIFQCDRCDKAYYTRTNLVDHVRRIHKDEQHKCNICNKVYGSPMLLSFHVARHNRVVSKYQCKECGVCCTTNYGLKEHTKIHTGEQPFDCKVCGKKFASLSQLKTHASVHGTSKPHVCHVCGKGFKNRSTLGRHEGRHLLDDSDYIKKCPVCPSATFRKVWILKQHMEKKHPNTAALDEVLEKFKGIDDAPKSKKSSQRRKRRASDQQLGESVSESEGTDDDEEEVAVVEENSDAEDVKPCVEGQEDEDVTTAATPSRQSARLMGKGKTKKILVVLAKDIAKDS